MHLTRFRFVSRRINHKEKPVHVDFIYIFPQVPTRYPMSLLIYIIYHEIKSKPHNIFCPWIHKENNCKIFVGNCHHCSHSLIASFWRPNLHLFSLCKEYWGCICLLWTKSALLLFVSIESLYHIKLVCPV